MISFKTRIPKIEREVQPPRGWTLRPPAHQTQPVKVIQKVQPHPGWLRSYNVLNLQPAIGNRTTGRLICQSKHHWSPVGSPALKNEAAAVKSNVGHQQAICSIPMKIMYGGLPVVQLKPGQIRAHRFLGLNVHGGVNPTLASRLDDVADRLRQDYAAAHNTPPASDADVRNWTGIYSIRGWRERRRPSNSKHCSGSAVDVNYTNQPYIVTRSQVNGREVLGGEAAGAGLVAERQATVDVFDRAKEFVFGRINIVVPIGMPFGLIPLSISIPNRADVGQRRGGESTGDVFDRFKETSDALGTYLGLAFDIAPDTVRRRPIRNIETASEADLLRAIPTTERRTEAAGIAAIEAYIRAHLTTAGTGSTFHFSAADVGRARDFYFRMLRDYEHVRIPMVRGNPVARPAETRNPARGFLDMSREFVVAMADVGRLRWGISDLGPAESGDTHHFDLGNHGGVRPDCLR